VKRPGPLGFLLDAAGWPDTRRNRCLYVVCVLILVAVFAVIVYF
jgi:hypothetical protein